MASSLNVPYEQVRLTAPAVGGSFGSKLYSGNVQPLVFTAVMAKAAGCPVMFNYSKEEHFAIHQNRMVTKAHLKFGMKKDGLASAVIYESGCRCRRLCFHSGIHAGGGN